MELNVVLSGNKRLLAKVRIALQDVGFSIVDAPKNEWGLSSYQDPITAQMAGQPNSGHQPGTQHPATLRWLVQDGDHAPGCTRRDREEDEEVSADEHELFLDCEHVGQTEERANDSKHVGQPYARDERVGFVGGRINYDGSTEAQHLLVSSAHDAVEALGWTLRLHHDTPITPPKPTLAQKLDRLGIDPAELAALIKGA